MELDLANTNFEVFLGPNVSSVVSLAKISQWFDSRLAGRNKEFKVSPDHSELH